MKNWHIILTVGRDTFSGVLAAPSHKAAVKLARTLSNCGHFQNSFGTSLQEYAMRGRDYSDLDLQDVRCKGEAKRFVSNS